MKLGGIENKARIAVALFVVALLLTIGLSLTLYFESRRQLSAERVRRAKLEAALVGSTLPLTREEITEAGLAEHLRRVGIAGAVGVFTDRGELLASASTTDRLPGVELLSPRFLKNRQPATAPSVSSLGTTVVRTEGGFDLAEFPAARINAILVLARPIEGEGSPLIFYVFSYQIIALVVGLGLLLLLVRWLLRPYRRMLEAARGSPVSAPQDDTESEFVVKTFHALIDQLRISERELAQLHSAERKRAEKSEQFSERLIANIPSGLVTISSNHQVTAANEHAREIFGPIDGPGRESSPGLQTLAVDFREFFVTAPRMVELIANCLNTGTSFRREEVEVTDPDGRVRHLGLSVSPISDGHQKTDGALCLMTDITEVMELRERMKLQESLANLGEMAAGLAHEFKNSLATIHGYIQLLDASGNAGAEKKTRTLDAALNEVRLLARLVTDFLNFARPQQIHLTDVDLGKVIEESAAEIAGLLEQYRITLRIEGEFATLAGDESLLRRAFVNLLRNASEAIDTQSPAKEIRVTSSLDTGRGRRYAHVRIRDTGGGISEENLGRIFIPFFTTKSRGYGIGLALVQKILVAHGGSVNVEQSDRTGTTFHCRLPLSPLSHPVEK
jgi:nitrogen fixation/metabolism regulation signal transduction histidine kinase